MVSGEGGTLGHHCGGVGSLVSGILASDWEGNLGFGQEGSQVSDQEDSQESDQEGSQVRSGLVPVPGND